MARTGPQPVRPVLTAACVAVLGLCAFLAGSPKGAGEKYRHRLVDTETGKVLGGMVRMIETAKGNIRARGVFSSPAARDKLLALYDQAATDLRDRMKRRGQ